MGNAQPASAFRGPSPELAMYSVDGFGLDAAWDEEQRLLWDTALSSGHQDAHHRLVGHRALGSVHQVPPDAPAAPARTALDAMATAKQLQDAGYTPANGAS